VTVFITSFKYTAIGVDIAELNQSRLKGALFMANEDSNEKHLYKSTWGKMIFYVTVVVVVIFFWWLLIYSHGVTSQH